LSYTRPLLVREEDKRHPHLAVRGREAKAGLAFTALYLLVEADHAGVMTSR